MPKFGNLEEKEKRKRVFVGDSHILDDERWYEKEYNFKTDK